MSNFFLLCQSLNIYIIYNSVSKCSSKLQCMFKINNVFAVHLSNTKYKLFYKRFYYYNT